MRSYLKFLYPGMHLKRWLLLIAIGIALVGLGIGYLLTQVYRTQPFPEWVGLVTLQFIDRWIGMVVCGVLSLARLLLGGRHAESLVRKPTKILFVKFAEQGSTVLAYHAIRRAIEMVGSANVYFLVFQ